MRCGRATQRPRNPDVSGSSQSCTCLQRYMAALGLFVGLYCFGKLFTDPGSCACIKLTELAVVLTESAEPARTSRTCCWKLLCRLCPTCDDANGKYVGGCTAWRTS